MHRTACCRSGAQLWALDMAVDAAGAPVTDRAGVDLALALARPLDENLTLTPAAFSVTGPARWRLLSVVPWTGGPPVLGLVARVRLAFSLRATCVRACG